MTTLLDKVKKDEYDCLTCGNTKAVHQPAINDTEVGKGYNFKLIAVANLANLRATITSRH